MKWSEFKSNVQGWAQARGIYEHSTQQAQLLKTVSELGELADGIIKDDIDAVQDAIGDITVCLVNYAYMCDFDLSVDYLGYADLSSAKAVGVIASRMSTLLRGSLILSRKDTADDIVKVLVQLAITKHLTFADCCESAWHEIKDRKGHMTASGAFVKEEAS